MSNYTDFFPLAGGGGGGGSEITDPTKLPLLMTQKDDTGTFPESPLNMFFSMNETGVDDYDEADILSSPNLANPLLGTSTTTGSATSAPNTPCLLYTSPSPRDRQKSRMPSSA